MEKNGFYAFLWKMALPLVLFRLWKKGKKQPLYRQHWQERLAKNLPSVPENKNIIWLHAVSVGEMNAARPFLQLLLEKADSAHLLLTTTTPTGRATAQSLGWANSTLCYLPYDEPCRVARFLTHFHPLLALFMETEIWPEYLRQLQARNIPAVLLNGRMSAQSARGYARFLKYFRASFASFRLTFAQSRADARRLQFLGAKNIQVVGNFKFDLQPNRQQIQAAQDCKKQFSKSFVVLAASTRKGEEQLILNAFLKSALHKTALLIIVPRHVERVDSIVEYAKNLGLSVEKRSEQLPSPHCAVWIGDSMGEMPFYYTLADAVLMGGTFLNTGGQNFIEAAHCGAAIILGESVFNFADAARKAQAVQAVRRVENVGEAFGVLENWSHDSLQLREMQNNAQHFAQSFGGASKKTLQALKDFLT